MTKKEREIQRRKRAEQDAQMEKIRFNPFDTRPKTARKVREQKNYVMPIDPLVLEKLDALSAYKSVDSGRGNTAKKESTQYTGNVVKGIATMHKSNAVPVLGEEDATEISRMRR